MSEQKAETGVIVRVPGDLFYELLEFLEELGDPENWYQQSSMGVPRWNGDGAPRLRAEKFLAHARKVRDMQKGVDNF